MSSCGVFIEVTGAKRNTHTQLCITVYIYVWIKMHGIKISKITRWYACTENWRPSKYWWSIPMKYYIRIIVSVNGFCNMFICNSGKINCNRAVHILLVGFSMNFHYYLVNKLRFRNEGKWEQERQRERERVMKFVGNKMFQFMFICAAYKWVDAIYTLKINWTSIWRLAEMGNYLAFECGVCMCAVHMCTL